MSDYRNRITAMELHRGRDLTGNDGNFRMHPAMQKRALEGSLEQRGITRPLLAYHSPRNDGALTLIDGHCRSSDHPDQMWPVCILDLTDQEADEDLLMGDTITGWAQIDPVKMNELVSRARVENDKFREAADRIRNSIRDQVEIARKLNGQGNVEEEKKAVSRDYDRRMTEQRGRAVKVVVDVGEHLPTVEQALKATKIRNRGEALAAVCQFFLDRVEDKPDATH